MVKRALVGMGLVAAMVQWAACGGTTRTGGTTSNSTSNATSTTTSTSTTNATSTSTSTGTSTGGSGSGGGTTGQASTGTSTGSVDAGAGCRSSGDCLNGQRCALADAGSGVCVAVEKAGPCASDGDCQSGSCLGGFCCGDSCLTGDPCGAAACDATGACVYPDAGVICSQACADATLTVSSCNGAGSCALQVTTCGNNLGCNPSDAGCLTTCQGDLDCAENFSCDAALDGGSCVYRLGFGSPCATAENCASAICAGGDCCGSSCPAAADTGCGASGCDATGACLYPTCGGYRCPIGSSTCATSCASDADCSGGTHCDLALDGGSCITTLRTGPCAGDVDCGSDACLGGNCCGASACAPGPVNGCGALACSPTGACEYPDCGPFACVPGTSTCNVSCASAQDCAVGDLCTDNSVCIVPDPVGTTCDDDSECVSQNCLGGLCCSGACTSEYSACGATACDTSGSCVYPAAGTVCDDCASFTVVAQATCDGVGNCDVAVNVPCPTGLSCLGGACGCGATGEECCGGTTCTDGMSICQANFCGVCGQDDAPCCPGNVCTLGTHCDQGTCLFPGESPAPNKP